jgi:hypothetical protein
MAAHGTPGRYNEGCHCDVCRAANTARLAKYRKKRRSTPPDEIPHGLNGYRNDGCRCDVCRAANDAANEVYSENRLEHMRRAQAESLDGAKRHGREWTGPELEVAARKDLSAREVAKTLGRTFAAVNAVRKKLREQDPRTVNLAGLPEDVDE